MSRGSGAALALLALATAGACAQSAMAPPQSPQPPAAARAEASSPARTHENLNAVVWMQTAVEYEATTRQAYAAARAALDAALADRRWTAALEQTSDAAALPPAIVLDLDETVLDNSAFQARQVAGGPGFNDTVWAAWCEERKAGAVPGAVEFLAYARSRGVTAFFITNRTLALEPATRDVLAKIGVPLDASGEDTVLTRGERSEWAASDKTTRRQFVAARYRILLLAGDDLGDFMGNVRGTVAERRQRAAAYAGYWGTKWIALPNPTYGSWEQAIVAGQPTPEAALAARFRALDLKQ